MAGSETYTFIGRLIPDRPVFRCSALPMTVHDTLPSGNPVVDKMTLSVNQGQIVVLVQTSENDLGDYARLKAQVATHVRGIVDANAYNSGLFHYVHIDSIILPDGNQSGFAFGSFPSITAKNADGGIADKHPDRPFSTQQLVELLAVEPSLPRTFEDLREAVMSETAFHCFRAIETMRHTFEKPADGDDQKPGWIRMGIDLRIDKSWIADITEKALAARHGRFPAMSPEMAEEIYQRTWTVVDRFCIFLHRGRRPLPEGEFDELNG